MRRYCFEFEDFPWFPDALRSGMMDYLHFLFGAADLYRPVVPLLARALAAGHTHQLLDLCSGGGGGLPQVVARLRRHTGAPVRLTLTDKYPNQAAFRRLAETSGGSIAFERASVDATCVPDELPGVRTMFAALHHFGPEACRRILLSAVEARRPVALFDGGDKNLLFALGMFLHPLVLWLCTPFLRPFRWQRLLLTYVLPLIPLCTVWDGLASVLRLYRPADLQRLVESLPPNDYHWETGKLRYRSVIGIAYLIGYPREARHPAG
jgi:hypothetical protein